MVGGFSWPSMVPVCSETYTSGMPIGVGVAPIDCASSSQSGPTSASEDFGSFGVQWHSPSVFWFVGGTDPDVYEKARASGRVSELPTNHNPRFAPVLHPTLETGVAALVVASRAWLGGPDRL